MSIRASAIRSFDRWDGLILILATVVPILRDAVLPTPTAPPWTHMPTTVPPSPPTYVGSIGTMTTGVNIPKVGAPYRPDVSPTLTFIKESLLELMPFLTAWMAALWIIRMRRPRPSWRRLIRQPGLAAGSVGLLVLAWDCVSDLISRAVIWAWPSPGLPPPPGPFFTPLTSLGDWFNMVFAYASGSEAIPHAVAATWLVMLLGGWWRPERSAIDRLGRAVGGIWIVLLVAVFAG